MLVRAEGGGELKQANTICRRLVRLATVVGLFGLALIAAPRDGIAEPKARFSAGDIEVIHSADNVIEWADMRALGAPLQTPTVHNQGTELSVILWDERRGPVRTKTGGADSYAGNVQSVVNGLQVQ